MGLPMTQNLKKNGYSVKAFDITPEARQKATEAGINTVESVAEVSSDVDYIVTALPQTHHVEETLKMEGGIFENAKKGAYICDVSTISPPGAQ